MLVDTPGIARIKKALRFSTAEGMAYGAFLGFGENFLVAYAIALYANNLQIGLLCSLPGFLASLAQLWDVEIVRLMKSRKSVVLTFSILQGLMFLPIISLAFFFRDNQAWWLMLFAALYSIFGALVSPAWGSLMADIVPLNLRGRYFSLRGSLSTLINIITLLAGGIFLNILVRKALWGFAILFGAAILARLISWLLLTRLYEKPGLEKESGHIKAQDFSKGLLSTNLGKYILFLFAMNFAVNIASPYFTVFQLKDLSLSYLQFAILQVISSIFTILAISHWGRAADRAGNLKVMILSSALIPMVPLLWIISPNFAYLGFVQAYSGLAWAGFNLCSVNYLYDATTTENRTRYLAYYNAGNGIAVGIGALLGGYLLPHLPPLMGHQLLSLFLISGILRIIVSILFLPHIKEVRRVRDVNASELFHILMGGRPVDRRASPRKHPVIHHH